MKLEDAVTKAARGGPDNRKVAARLLAATGGYLLAFSLAASHTYARRKSEADRLDRLIDFSVTALEAPTVMRTSVPTC